MPGMEDHFPSSSQDDYHKKSSGNPRSVPIVSLLRHHVMSCSKKSQGCISPSQDGLTHRTRLREATAHLYLGNRVQESNKESNILGLLTVKILINLSIFQNDFTF